MPSGSNADRFAKVWHDKALDPLPSGWKGRSGGSQQELFRQTYVPHQYRQLNETAKQLEHRWGHYFKTHHEFKQGQDAFNKRQAHFEEKQKVWGAQLDEYLNKPQLLDVGGGQQVEQKNLEGHIEGLKGSWDEQQTLDLANFKSAAAGVSPNQTQGVQWKRAPSTNYQSMRRNNNSKGASAAKMKISGVNI